MALYGRGQEVGPDAFTNLLSFTLAPVGALLLNRGETVVGASWLCCGLCCGAVRGGGSSRAWRNTSTVPCRRLWTRRRRRRAGLRSRGVLPGAGCIRVREVEDAVEG
eukprot:1505647-Pyramimonas_sp.AAC.1